MFAPPAPWTLWFVTMIVLFYLAAPFLVHLTKSPVKFVAITGAAWAALALTWWATRHIDARMLIYLPVFAAGVLLARYRPSMTATRWAVLLATVAVSYVISLRASGDADYSPYSLPLALTGPLAIVLALQGRLPAWRPVALIASGSFGLYLFHRPVYLTVLAIAALPNGRAKAALLFLVAFPIAIVFGITIERFYGRLVDRLQMRSPRISS